jgi:biotin synthase
MDILRSDNILSVPLDEIISAADKVRRENFADRIELCGIVNAKSGKCGEDCKFCAQSVHHNTSIYEYSLRSKDDIVKAARKARDNGAEKFGIVTSGNRLTLDEVKIIADAIRKISETVDISPCASLGALDGKSFAVLKEAGLTRYHHNLETSENFYSKIVSTHDYRERVDTIKIAKGMDLEVCSGGIIGMGETWQDRIDMALLLKRLEVDSVPLNFLVPVEGTPLEGLKTLSREDALRTIALFRIILKDKIIKVAAGRESVLKDSQKMIYMAGANGMMIGGYLTVAGRPVSEDHILIQEVKEIWNKK